MKSKISNNFTYFTIIKLSGVSKTSIARIIPKLTYRIEKLSSTQTYEVEVNLIEKYDPLSKTFPPTSNINNISF